MFELKQKLAQLESLLAEENQESVKHGVAFAEAKAEWRKAVSTETLKAVDDGMAKTIIHDVVRGLPHVADLECQMNIEEALYKASHEAVNIDKKRYDTTREELERIWRTGGMKYEYQ